MTSIIKVDTIQSAAGSTVLEQTNATTITLGTSGQTIVPASNVTLSGIATTNGITEADQWRLTTSASGNNEPLTSNLSRVDKFGTGMTESSGVFTFPSTGYWWIRFTARFIGDAESRYLEGKIQKTTDNSNYTNGAISSCATSDFGTGNIELSSSCDFLFDVTNTSTHKVRFSIGMQNTSFSAHGTAATNLTSMTFLRLGDT